ncbi:TadE/TadG family type IV pilus assembly protein [Agrobacterium deltaense]|uniref:TadE/TadG family type IV pilus assembly protein n=1 Tax=Agrobacterium deltaense TaxID=1183412 RepID=UPI003FD1F0F6
MIFIQTSMERAMILHVHLRRILGEDRGGNAAIEFALIAPILAIILAGSTDLGLLIFSRFQLEATISDSTSYAMVHADQVGAENGDDLAAKIATIVASEDTSGDTTASIVVNNGAQANYGGMKIKLGGAASHANACYCPTGTASSLIWGQQRSCGTFCSDGAPAGKYIAITAKQTYAPLFSSYGIVKDGFIYASAIVRTQ